MSVFLLYYRDDYEPLGIFLKEEDAWAAARTHAGFHEDEESIKRWYDVEEHEVQ